MTCRMIATVRNDAGVTRHEGARIQTYLLKLKGLLDKPGVDIGDDFVVIRWNVPTGILHATGMWWPMLIGAFIAVDRTVDEASVIDVRFREEQP